MGRFEAAIHWLQQAIATNRDFSLSYFYLAAALALTNREAEARDAVEAGLQGAAQFRVGHYRAETFGGNPVFLAQRERVCRGMIKAGIPD